MVGHAGLGLALAIFVASLAVAGTGAVAADGDRAMVPVVTGFDQDETVIEITVQADGTAIWRVQYRRELADSDARSAFGTLEETIDENPGAFTRNFSAGMHATAASAADRTGRPMAVENVTVRAQRRQLDREYGIVTYTFVWTNFARERPDGALVAGDALESLFVRDENSSVVVGWSPTLAADSVAPEPDVRREWAAVYRGPIDFATGEPHLVLTPTSQASGLPLGLLGGGGLAVATVVLAGYGLVRRRRPAGDGSDGAEGEGSEPSSDADPDQDTSSDAAHVPAADADPALLSDEERVLRLVRDNGGRLKQQELVATVEWSETKTSDVVQRMREEDLIEVYRLGRENVLALPGEMDL